MATTKIDQKEDDSLWDISVCNKSWVDIVEETKSDELKVKIKDNTITKETRVTRHSLKILSEKVIEESSKHGVIDINNTEVLKSDQLPNFGKHLQATPEKVSVKNERQDFLQDDLSLTGHLDKFNLVSPCKVDKTECLKNRVSPRVKRTPTNGESNKRKFPIFDNKSEGNDDMLMPSPSKIPRSTPSSTKRDKGRKRLRDLGGTPNSDKKKREAETDPEVIARRQKQIDYGKNTIGYDRYTQLVPRDARTKIHPKTPPIHLKFSRRAWDGLVKVWRQRLHFWDPPSEGGGNPDCLEISDFSDYSSTEGSLPSTPVQEWKRQRNSRAMKKLIPENKEEVVEVDFANQGCTPLAD
ncbi:histone RNA hairpin-binding protein [Cimex lectularius]|uniref:Histone RNA hairpin-binding protein RNA-binding domain-containing protein n=1 Tax=Cimex lectularius TaxID=79782 RepID=A0A8I6THL8_CIMLE|nr:histone RNA hairpin-binding protein [Cimex lectularius]